MDTLKLLQPVWLLIIFRHENDGVDEDENDYEPVEPLRLDRLVTSCTTSTIPFDTALPERNRHRSFYHAKLVQNAAYDVILGTGRTATILVYLVKTDEYRHIFRRLKLSFV